MAINRRANTGIVSVANQIFPGKKKPLGNKKASTPGLNCQSGWPQTLLFISPSVGTVPVPCLASDHARSRFDDGGGLLRADKYHTRKVCQDGIAAHELKEKSVQFQG
jgi:hypothetical protein